MCRVRNRARPPSPAPPASCYLLGSRRSPKKQQQHTRARPWSHPPHGSSVADQAGRMCDPSFLFLFLGGGGLPPHLLTPGSGRRAVHERRGAVLNLPPSLGSLRRAQPRQKGNQMFQAPPKPRSLVELLSSAAARARFSAQRKKHPGHGLAPGLTWTKRGGRRGRRRRRRGGRGFAAALWPAGLSRAPHHSRLQGRCPRAKLGGRARTAGVLLQGPARRGNMLRIRNCRGKEGRGRRNVPFPGREPAMRAPSALLLRCQ